MVDYAFFTIHTETETPGLIFFFLSRMKIDIMSNFSCSPINKLQQEQRCGFMMALAYQPH